MSKLIVVWANFMCSLRLAAYVGLLPVALLPSSLKDLALEVLELFVNFLVICYCVILLALLPLKLQFRLKQVARGVTFSAKLALLLFILSPD